jgi:Guanosine polyphosphate pyrophosphohydrolases/synthetases
MAKKGREFNEIYDLTAMRVIVERGGDEGRATATARSA